MKKVYLLAAVSLLAMSLLLAGCGAADKSAATNATPKTEKYQDMSNMDHSQMDLDDHMNGNN